MVKGLGCRVHCRAVTRWKKAQEGAELSWYVSWTEGLGTDTEAVSREITVCWGTLAILMVLSSVFG